VPQKNYKNPKRRNTSSKAARKDGKESGVEIWPKDK
jgi:hypothetical protein